MSCCQPCWVLAVGMLGVVACTGGSTQRLADFDPRGQRVAGGRWQVSGEVVREMGRENQDLPVHTVALQELEDRPAVHLLSCREPQRLSSSREGVSHVQVCVDHGVEADCVVRDDRVDLAQAFQRAHAEVVKRLGNRQYNTDGVHLVEDSAWPTLMMRVEYITSSGHYGALLMAASNVRDHGVFCSMDAPGYRQTFQRLVRELTASLAAAVEETAVHRSFHAVLVDGKFMGLEEDIWRPREDGTHSELTFAALVEPADAALNVTDDVSVEIVEPDDSVGLLRIMRQRNGELVGDLRAMPHATSHRMEATGVWRGKEQHVELGSQAPASGRTLRAFYVQAMQSSTAGKKASGRLFLRYFPGLDSQTLAEETVEMLMPLEEGARFRSTIRTPGHAVEAEYDVDAHGERVRVVVQSGQRSVALERL